MAKPDFYYGAQPKQANQEVNKCLSRYIIASASTSFPITPNFVPPGAWSSNNLASLLRTAIKHLKHLRLLVFQPGLSFLRPQLRVITRSHVGLVLLKPIIRAIT